MSLNTVVGVGVKDLLAKTVIVARVGVAISQLLTRNLTAEETGNGARKMERTIAPNVNVWKKPTNPLNAVSGVVVKDLPAKTVIVARVGVVIKQLLTRNMTAEETGNGARKMERTIVPNVNKNGKR
jgi:ribosomal protein S17